MKRTFVVLVCLLMMLILPGVSSAAQKIQPYISAQVGGTYLTDAQISDYYGGASLDYTPGFSAGLAGGAKYGMFRVEGEFGYQINEIDMINSYDTEEDGLYTGEGKGDVSAYTFLINGYADFDTGTPFTPFVTAGMGMAIVELNNFMTMNNSDNVFAYQVGAGLSYAINPKMNVDLKYRYLATTDPSFGGMDAEFASHNLYLGFRYNF
jgi:opacity protein-like surface antigen